jgi:uncharacterized membrane protein
MKKKTYLWMSLIEILALIFLIMIFYAKLSEGSFYPALWTSLLVGGVIIYRTLVKAGW